MSKRRSIRDVQHKLAEVVAEVQRGEVVLITKRGRVMAKILRASDDDAADKKKNPNFAMRRKAMFPDGTPSGELLSELISSMRERA